eukprot:12914731-Prorocentrum_lima.AAC.1
MFANHEVIVRNTKFDSTMHRKDLLLTSIACWLHPDLTSASSKAQSRSSSGIYFAHDESHAISGKS